MTFSRCYGLDYVTPFKVQYKNKQTKPQGKILSHETELLVLGLNNFYVVAMIPSLRTVACRGGDARKTFIIIRRTDQALWILSTYKWR